MVVLAITKFALIVFGIIPIAIGVSALIGSIYCLVRAPSIVQTALGCLSIPLLTISVWLIFSMLAGLWPSILPHVVIAAMSLIVVLQLFILRVQRPKQSRGFQVHSDVPIAAIETEYPASERRW